MDCHQDDFSVLIARLNLLKAIPTFIPAFFGAYTGVFLRKLGFKLKMRESA